MSDWLKLRTKCPCLPLGDGRGLRLLTAQELLEARREAETLFGSPAALCSNACLLARAVIRQGRPCYRSGADVLRQLTPEEIQTLSARWAKWNQEVNPGFGADSQRVEKLKKTLAGLPRERLQWFVLRRFGALPTEPRAKEMTDRQFLWCALQLLLDEQEALDALCPACRAEAEQGKCPICGARKEAVCVGVNPAFDLRRFERLQKRDVL